MMHLDDIRASSRIRLLDSSFSFISPAATSGQMVTQFAICRYRAHPARTIAQGRPRRLSKGRMDEEAEVGRDGFGLCFGLHFELGGIDVSAMGMPAAGSVIRVVRSS